MRKTISKNLTIQFFLTNFLLVNIAYFGMQYFKRSTFDLDIRYFKLLLTFYAVWLGVSYLTGKFKITSYPDLKHAFLMIAKSNLFILYILSLIIVLKGLYAFSRIHLFGTVLILFYLEIAAFTTFYFIKGKYLINQSSKDFSSSLKFKNFSIIKLTFDVIAFLVSYYVINFYKRGTVELTQQYEELLLVIFAVWLLTSFFTRKYEKRKSANIFYAISPFVKSFIFSVAVMSLIVFAFRMFFYSRLQVFGTLSLALLFETSIYALYFIITIKSKKDQDIENYKEVHQLLEQEYLPFEVDHHDKNKRIQPVKDKLKTVYLQGHVRLYNFINQRVNLNKIDESETTVLNTHNLFNIQTLDNHTVSLFINLHKLNDIRWLNRYFLEVHKKIYNGGFFIGKADTNYTYKKAFYRKYSKVLADIFYPLMFILRRVVPKLPGLKQVYFFITRGKNRLLSKAEVLGRLYFCGFKIVDVKEIEDTLYFIAQRVKKPSVERNPSYGLTIKLRRIGLNGEIVYVNKFRTMHPYSEFLQEYIYEQNNLQDTGKFADDFRLTNWGKIFRKLWIDELPQIINFWQGDLNLVGVRALSQQYFDLYPEDFKKFRVQFKPGLVPPYYADMPKSFDEIVESEKKYLNQKQKHPFSTDVKYFFKVFYNIIFKQARSQ